MELTEIFANGRTDPGEMSEQELVSCDTNDSGCDGGWPTRAWSWVSANNGLTDAATYPYNQIYYAPSSYYPYSPPTISCEKALLPLSKLVTTGVAVPLPTATPTSSASAFAASEAAIMQAIYQGYPVTLAVSAQCNCFQGYFGSSDSLNCGTCGATIDHAILAIGWNAHQIIGWW